MLTRHIGQGQAPTPKIFRRLEETTLNSIRSILPDEVIHEGCRAADYTYRERILTPVVTVLHMVLAALWPDESFAASWQVMWFSMKSRWPEKAERSPSSASVAKARARLPLAVWRYICDWISSQAQDLSSSLDRWRGLRVVLLDGMCVSMPASEALFAAFGRPEGRYGAYRYPLARLVALSLANTMTVISHALGAYTTDETVLADELLTTLRKGDLLVADRHFAAAHFYVKYQNLGLEFLTRVHQRLKISRIQRVVSFGRNDFVGRLKIGPLYRRKDPSLPAHIRVRFIRSRMCIRGRVQNVWLVTSLTDVGLYPAKEIAEVYASRWRIETLFKEVKIDLSADVLRSKSPQQIHKEITARIAALNIVRTIMLTAAEETGADPLRISFVSAVRAILTFAPAMARENVFALPGIYRTMLAEIAAHLVPERPGRNEPRMITREQRHYPLMKIDREQWRQENAA